MLSEVARGQEERTVAEAVSASKAFFAQDAEVPACVPEGYNLRRFE